MEVEKKKSYGEDYPRQLLLRSKIFPTHF